MTKKRKYPKFRIARVEEFEFGTVHQNLYSIKIKRGFLSPYTTLRDRYGNIGAFSAESVKMLIEMYRSLD